MKRLALCAAIIAVIIASSIVSLIMLRNAGKELYERIDRCLLYCYLDSTTAAAELEELSVCWGEYYVKASFLTRSSSLDDISGSVARLEPLLRVSADDFAAELNSIRSRVELLYESQIPHWRSVF